jgi:curli production assembly/transport component CsgF
MEMFMNRMAEVCLVLLAAAQLLASAAFASSMVYTPVNPTFGGSPLNASQLLSEASINRPKDKASEAANAAPTSAQQIASQIQGSVLAQISSAIAAQIYGPGAQNSGSFDLGAGASIVFNTVGGNIQLTVNDGKGGVTQLNIPKPTI